MTFIKTFSLIFVCCFSASSCESSREALDQDLKEFPNVFQERINANSKAMSASSQQLANIFEMVNSELDLADEKLATALNNTEAVKTELANSQADNKKLKDDLDVANADIRKFEAQITKLKSEIKSIQDELKNAKEKSQDLEIQVAKSKNQIKDLQGKLSVSLKNINGLETKVKLLEGENHDLKSSNVALSTENKSLKESLSEQIEKLKIMEEKNKQLVKEVAECQSTKTPTGFELVGGRFVKHFTEKKTWGEAEAECQKHGAHLITVEDNVTTEWIKKVDVEVWIGANDMEKEGKWVWVDKTPVVNFKWDIMQPDSGYGMINEDCLVSNHNAKINWLYRGKWGDKSCNRHFSFICELPK